MTILLFVATLALAIGGLVHLMSTDDDNVRFLSKFVWSIIIVFVPILGPIAWFGLGRRWTQSEARTEWRRRLQASRETPRPERVETTPEEDDAAIEAEILFHEKQAEIRRLEAEVARKLEDPPEQDDPAEKDQG